MRLVLLSSLILLISNSYSQQTITDTIVHDGINRTYILYVPASYSPSNAVPLVFNFHGYTSNSTEQMFYGDFRQIADTANFLLVHPMGTLDGSSQPYWNANWGGAVDDIGFTSALIDSLSFQYNINQNRVYSTGMSNGGFMSYTLACSLSNKIAAIASVTGTMNLNQSLTCSPVHPMPVMEIHGTADATVPYNGTGTMSSMSNTLSYWVGFNQCDVSPNLTAVPNINTIDGCTAEHYVYENGNNGVEVEHYKVIDGGHTWPGAPVQTGVTNYDFNASEKIWQFFAQYDINGKINTTSIGEINEDVDLKLYPNPAAKRVAVHSNKEIESIELIDVTGKIISTFRTGFSSIDIADIPVGMHFVKVKMRGTEVVRKLIKQ